MDAVAEVHRPFESMGAWFQDSTPQLAVAGGRVFLGDPEGIWGQILGYLGIVSWPMWALRWFDDISKILVKSANYWVRLDLNWVGQWVAMSMEEHVQLNIDLIARCS